MFRKVTIFSHKIISLLLVLVFLQLFIMAYVVSLVIVKPRDVTGVFLLASKYFISNDEEIKIDSEKVTLSWNKSELSFDFNFIDNNTRLMANVFGYVEQYDKPFVFASSQMSNMSYSPYGVMKRVGELYTKSLEIGRAHV